MCFVCFGIALKFPYTVILGKTLIWTKTTTKLMLENLKNLRKLIKSNQINRIYIYPLINTPKPEANWQTKPSRSHTQWHKSLYLYICDRFGSWGYNVDA